MTRNRAPGAILVELAVILPFLVLLLMVAVDLGTILWEHQMVQNAAREGARFSTIPRNWIDPVNPGANSVDIEQRVVDYLQSEGITISLSNVTVSQSYPIDVGGGLTAYGSEIIVTYTRPLLISGGGLLPLTSVTLTGRAVFRNLY